MNATTTSANAPCNCSDNSGSSTVGLVPNKRVDYAYGMVLGVNDFRQEQLNFEWKSKLSNLLLHGYGTVCGLKVSVIATADGDFEMRIDPGFAVSPRGNWIWVERAQCAKIDQWVKGSKPASLSGPQTVYVKLCYEECATDLVPVASSACASQDQTRAASRITESFRASFSWDAPPEGLEDDIRLFGELMHRVEIVDDMDSPPNDEQLIDEVRGLITIYESPPHSPPHFGPIFLSRSTACETIRRALAVWVTEVRPVVGNGCMPPRKSDDCLLLAALHFVTDSAGNITSPIEVDEHKRAILAPSRVIQELLPCGCSQEVVASPPHAVVSAAALLPQQTFATLFAFDAQTVFVEIHYPNPLTVPSAAVSIKTLAMNGSVQLAPINVTVNPVPVTLNQFSLTLPAGTSLSSSVLATVQFNTLQITDAGTPLHDILISPSATLAYVDWDSPVLSAYLAVGIFDAGGDLGSITKVGNVYPRPIVTGIQNQIVSAAAPAPGNVLTFVSNPSGTSQWAPTPPASAYVQANHGSYAVVAAGVFNNAGGTLSTYNGLRANGSNGSYILTFPGFNTATENYIVKGTPQLSKAEALFAFNTVDINEKGFEISIRSINADSQQFLASFMVEITAYGIHLPANA